MNINKYNLGLFILVLLIINSSSAQKIELQDISNKSVMIVNEDDYVGSGVLIFSDPFLYLITSKHVLTNLIIQKKDTIFNIRSKILQVISYPRQADKANPDTLFIDMEIALKDSILKWSDDKDIAGIKLGFYLNGIRYFEGIERKKKTMLVPFNFKTEMKYFDDLNLGQDVYIIGYPKSLGIKGHYQYNFDRPLLRKGIVSGFENELRMIILDCPSYGGNSGGPVMVWNESDSTYNLVGIVEEFIPLEEKWINQNYGIINTQLINSGLTVMLPADEIKKFIIKYY